MNFENLNVKQLSKGESLNINGGYGMWIVKAFAGALLVELVVDGWAQCKADFMEGFNQ